MGWNGSNNDEAGNHKRPAASQTPKRACIGRGLVAGLMVVVGAGIVFYLMAGRKAATPAPAPASPTKAIHDVAKKPAPKASAQRTQNTSQESATPTASVQRTVVSSITNFGRVTTTYRRADGSFYEEAHDIVKPIVDNGTDHLLLMAAEHEPGEDAPPLPDCPGADKEFRNNLMSKPVVINEDDSEAVKAVKRRLSEMREAMLEEMKNGRRFEDVMAEHQETMNSCAELRREAVNGLREILEGGSGEDAKIYVEKMNAFLEERGIKKISIPKKYRKENGR